MKDRERQEIVSAHGNWSRRAILANESSDACNATLFLLLGDTHELGGYFASMDGTLKILGNEIVWDVEAKAEEAETPKVVVN